MSTDDRVINRIKKLLALAADPAAADGERDNALRMAYATMAKHNLSQQDVEGKPTGPQEARVERRAMDVYARPWALQVANYVGKLFFCRFYYVRSFKKDCAHLCFVGQETNATAAAEVASVLIASIFSEAKRRMRREGQNVTWRRSFCTGAAFKIGDRVSDLQRNGVALEEPVKDEDGEVIPQHETDRQAQRSTALVLVDLAKTEEEANDAWIKANVGGLRTEKSKAKTQINHGAYHSGREFGSSVGLSATRKLGG